MAVEIPLDGDMENVGRVDGFIDDLINVFLDTPTNCRRQPHVVPLAMHVTSRPHAGEMAEPIKRRALLSLPKLLAEGSPDEIQIVLGWQIDTRRMTIALPDDRFDAWMEGINEIIRLGGEVPIRGFGSADRATQSLVVRHARLEALSWAQTCFPDAPSRQKQARHHEQRGRGRPWSVDEDPIVGQPGYLN